MITKPSYSMRLNNTDKQNLLELSQLLRLRRADVIRYLAQKELNALKQSDTNTGHPAAALAQAR